MCLEILSSSDVMVIETQVQLLTFFFFYLSPSTKRIFAQQGFRLLPLPICLVDVQTLLQQFLHSRDCFITLRNSMIFFSFWMTFSIDFFSTWILQFCRIALIRFSQCYDFVIFDIIRKHAKFSFKKKFLWAKPKQWHTLEKNHFLIMITFLPYTVSQLFCWKKMCILSNLG